MSPPVPKPQKPTTDSNYGIDDLNSGDETDDEDQPKKRIPSWASGKSQGHRCGIRRFSQIENVW